MGSKGLPDAINTVWPAAIVQACVLHLIRNSFHYAGRHDWEKMAKDLRPIYQAINADVAAAQLEEFAGIWGQKYPAIIRLVALSLGRIHTVPRIRRRDTQDHLEHQRDRVPQRPLPPRGPSPRPLPDRARRAQVPVLGDPLTRPDRPRAGPLGRALEASVERIRDHLRRPYPPQPGELTTLTTYTVPRTLPPAVAGRV